jgi:phenylalanyl-tRNA synthetase alpha chain
MYLTKEDLNTLLNKRDLTQESNHCISLIENDIKDTLNKHYCIIPEMHRGNAIVSTEDNYASLGYNSNEVTLGARYTKYLSEDTMLRTHMTSTIPPLLKSYNKESDKLWMCSGVVYRRDVRDKTHVGEPHQMDIWHLTKEQKTREDLLELVSLIISVIEKHKNKKIKWRYNETAHHYTDDGIEIEIYHNNEWLELLECGLISKQLLSNNGLKEYSGLALGLGLERLVMIIKNIEDIRVLYSEKEDIKSQMTHLNKYKKVSNQPAIKRDLSIAIDKNINEEELTEIILNHVSLDVETIIESMTIVTETNYEKLPEVAIERLGMNENQKNVLLRIVLRDLDKSLIHEQVDKIHYDIYNLIHEGEDGYNI